MVETNVRTAYIHHFFTQNYKDQISATSVDNYKDLTFVGKGKISDRELLPYIEAAAEGQDPRTWHWALMDYGSYLKKINKNPSRASAHYVKQSKFEGSLRQIRGAILRELNKDALSEPVLRGRLNLPPGKFPQVKSVKIGLHPVRNMTRFDLVKFEAALAGLVRDGMVEKRKGKWQIA